MHAEIVNKYVQELVYSSPGLNPETYHSHRVRGKKYPSPHPCNNICVLQTHFQWPYMTCSFSVADLLKYSVIYCQSTMYLTHVDSFCRFLVFAATQIKVRWYNIFWIRSSFIIVTVEYLVKSINQQIRKILKNTKWPIVFLKHGYMNTSYFVVNH